MRRQLTEGSPAWTPGSRVLSDTQFEFHGGHGSSQVRSGTPAARGRADSGTPDLQVIHPDVHHVTGDAVASACSHEPHAGNPPRRFPETRSALDPASARQMGGARPTPASLPARGLASPRGGAIHWAGSQGRGALQSASGAPAVSPLSSPPSLAPSLSSKSAALTVEQPIAHVQPYVPKMRFSGVMDSGWPPTQPGRSAARHAGSPRARRQGPLIGVPASAAQAECSDGRCVTPSRRQPRRAASRAF